MNIHVDSSKQGETRTTTITLTGSDRDHIWLIDALNLVIDQQPGLRPLHDALCDGTPLVAKTWPPTEEPTR